MSNLHNHSVVSQAEWVAARQALLVKEKELTRERDRLMQQRRELPWVQVEKNYLFDGPDGVVALADLFRGRSQLIVQHFMFGPGWEEGCVGCSFGADHVDAARQHFEHHDVAFAAVSRAPWSEIAPFKQRMGWRFPWVSSAHSDFNYDFNVAFTPEQIASGGAIYNFEPNATQEEDLPGCSVFYRNAAGEIFRTYSAFGRGDESVLTTYMFLDMTPKGRDENGPNFNLTDWVRHHDRYDHNGKVDASGRAEKSDAGCCAKVQ
ncbi:MAG: thioredoxin [Verrucomicrobiaceae bacterium]|nr:thioredoxin [Verrucomicrobiaceae bacterium]